MTALRNYTIHCENPKTGTGQQEAIHWADGRGNPRTIDLGCERIWSARMENITEAGEDWLAMSQHPLWLK